MFVALLGHFIAGVPGAVVANGSAVRPELHRRLRSLAGRRTPSSGMLAYRRTDRSRAVTIGLIAASALIIAQGANRDCASVAITATTFALVYWTGISPLVAIACAALLGSAGSYKAGNEGFQHRPGLC